MSDDIDLTDARTFGLDETTIADLKAAWRRRTAGKQGVPCDSALCVCIATVRVFWAGTLPHEEYPVYCDQCAAKMRMVSETLGCKYHAESLPVPPERTQRAIAIAGPVAGGEP